MFGFEENDKDRSELRKDYKHIKKLVAKGGHKDVKFKHLIGKVLLTCRLLPHIELGLRRLPQSNGRSEITCKSRAYA